MTNRLRTEGTDHLLAAGRAVGREAVRRPELRRLAATRASAGRSRPRMTRSTTAPAEARARDAGGDPASRERGDRRRVDRGHRASLWRLLRSRHLAQPSIRTATQVEMIRKRQFPIVGNGGGVWSFIHIEDAAAATVGGGRARRSRASTTSSTTIPRRSRLPARAGRARVGAKPPRHFPRWVGRLRRPARPRRSMMTEVRGASNAKAKRELGWELALPELAAGLRGGAQAEHGRSSELLDELRPDAFAIAYRMLGSVSEAEDVVQEALLRLHNALERGRARSTRRGPTRPPSRPAWRSTSCARPAPGARPTSASGCPSRSSTTPGDDPGPAGGDGGLAVPRLPRAARDPDAGAARRIPAA